jgi:hypothetical protein
MSKLNCFVLLALISAAMAQIQPSPTPFINQPLVPDAAKPGSGAFTLKVQGTAFGSGSVIRWNDKKLKTTFVSNTELTARVAASEIAKAGTATVTVKNPSPGGGFSNVAYFQVTTQAKKVSFNGATYPAGQEPYALVSGDFNKDGIVDLAVANVTGGTVSILLGNGDGTFKAQNQIQAGYGPIALGVGDFNGDGKLDLAVANNGNASNGKPGTVTILLGNGKGGFRLGGTFDTGSGPDSVAVGDFNGDGELDLALSNYNVGRGNTVAVLLGNGDGTFQPYVSYPTGSAPESIATEDLNGDGILDLVTANEFASTVSVLLGNGDGTFKSNVDYATGKAPIAIAVADLNGDNKPDLVAVDLSANAVSVLLGNGDGTFQSHVDYPTPSAPVALAIADFNADQHQDLLVVNQGANNVSFLSGKGNGTFKPHVDFNAGSEPQGIAIADFNGDGRLDVSVVNVFSTEISVLLQTSK